MGEQERVEANRLTYDGRKCEIKKIIHKELSFYIQG